MNKLGVRVGAVAMMASALTAGAFLTLPAHASNTTICTSRTGKALCVSADTGKRLLNAQVYTGTAPQFHDVTSVGITCFPGHLVITTSLNGKGTARDLPLGC